jgi:hypothetical protein
MRALRVVGLDHAGALVCECTERGERFTLPVDDKLRAAARGELARVEPTNTELEKPMRPREIQARIRAGESVEQVAAFAGMSPEKVDRFAYPVLLERSRTAELAQQAHPIRQDGPEVRTLGEVVAGAFAQRGQDYSAAVWDSWRGDDGKWVIQLQWQAGRSENRAHWTFHPGAHGGTVTTLDDLALDLIDPEAGISLRTVRPVTPLAEQPTRVEEPPRRSERFERPERVEQVERPERTERFERPERLERVERPERTERYERPERLERVGHPEQAERYERPERLERVEHPEQAERYERPERLERVEHPEQAERYERPEQAERFGRPERTERPEKAEPLERAEHPERPEKAERPGRAERLERAERPERIERPEKAERPGRAERPERPERVERTERPAARQEQLTLDEGAEVEPAGQPEAAPEPEAQKATGTTESTPNRRGKRNHPIVPSWEDVLLGVRSNR